jgi:hypothetical protein
VGGISTLFPEEPDLLIQYAGGRYSIEQISRFLKYYAIDVKGYKQECNKLFGNNATRHEFALLHRYPIIEARSNEFYLPLKILLINAVSANPRFPRWLNKTI